MVQSQRGRKDASGGSEVAERLGPVRHARQRVGVVSGLVGDRYYATSPMDDPTGASRRLVPGGPGRQLVRRRVLLPGVVPQRVRPGYRGSDLGFRVARTVSLPVSGTASPQKSAAESPQSKDRPTPKPSPPAAKPVPPWHGCPTGPLRRPPSPRSTRRKPRSTKPPGPSTWACRSR